MFARSTQQQQRYHMEIVYKSNGLPKLFRCLNGFVDFASVSPIFRRKQLPLVEPNVPDQQTENGFGNDETSNFLSRQFRNWVKHFTAMLSR